MNVPTMTMDREEAREKLRHYRRRLHKHADAEFEAAAAGYEAMGQGKALVDLGEVFRGCSFDEKGRPNLALARADRKQVRVTGTSFLSGSNTHRGCAFEAYDFRWHWQEPVNSRDLVTRFIFSAPRPIQTGYALVPMIPAECHPGVSKLRDRFILWEVEAWSDVSLRAEPDRDPFLLTHLHGDLYVVEAEWDLTDLERAVMAGRREA